MTIMKPIRTALITGASSGLGEVFAHKLAKEGYQLILVARRLARLDALIQQLQAIYPQKMIAIEMDLAKSDAPSTLMSEVQQQGLTVDVLINNAGYSPSETIGQQTPAVVAAQIQVMLTAPTLLCHAVLPHMRAQKFGRIINVSSLAAFAPAGRGTLYSAIKQYVMTFSHSLALEVQDDGVNVSALCPGFTHTEFHDVMQVSEKASKIPSLLWTDATFVVNKGWKAVNAGHIICVPGYVNQIVGGISKVLPEFIRHRLGNMNPLA